MRAFHNPEISESPLNAEQILLHFERPEGLPGSPGLGDESTAGLGPDSAAKSVLWLTADLDDAEREKLAPGLGSYVDGPISMTVENEPEGSRITLDLNKTVLSLPWMGWQKASGVPATLSFRVDTESKDGLTVLEDLTLSGSGLAAHGSVTLDKDGLLSTTLTHVALSEGDDDRGQGCAWRMSPRGRQDMVGDPSRLP